MTKSQRTREKFQKLAKQEAEARVNPKPVMTRAIKRFLKMSPAEKIAFQKANPEYFATTIQPFLLSALAAQ